MVGVENFLKVALHNATLGAQVLNHSLASINQNCLPGLEATGAVRETYVRVTCEIRSALCNLLCDVVAWVGNGGFREEERHREGDKRRRKIDHSVGFLENSTR